ncbi:MAG: hypothetical protein K2O54_01210, partial [Prevotella sp.]|nr:hypothetical protein [Prevotella sp.]
QHNDRRPRKTVCRPQGTGARHPKPPPTPPDQARPPQSHQGPYLDREGRDMALGGGTLFLEGDKLFFEATGHCAAYHFGDEDIFICHGYSTSYNGAAILIQRPIRWTSDGWPELKEE